MYNLKALILVLFIMSCGYAFGQAVVTDNEMDKKYAPNENSIFNSTRKNKESGGGSYTPEINFKNAVKYCPTMLIRQKILFVYERKIYDGFSFSFGLGKAFGDDIFQTIGPISTGTVLNTELRHDDLLNKSTYYKSRPLIYTGAKIYFSGNAFEGGFLEFTYRREAMDYTIESINSINFEGTNVATFKTNAFTFGFGFSGVSGKKDNITHEFFMNMGLKNINYSRFEKTYVGNSTTASNNDYVYKLGEGNLNYKIAPSFNIGYMFGFGF